MRFIFQLSPLQIRDRGMPQAEKVALPIPLVSIEARCQILPSSRAHNVLFMYHALEVHHDCSVTINGQLTFSVASTDPATNNRSLQRPNKYETSFGFPPNTFHFVGLDETSPTSRANLTSDTLSSETTNTTGHMGYLNMKTQYDVGNTTQYLFSFGNSTLYPNATNPNWILADLGKDNIYEVYHVVPKGLINGFVLCEASFDLDDGPWYDLTYVTYTSTPAELSGCEFVGIQGAIMPLA
jgi:hypothetical protein